MFSPKKFRALSRFPFYIGVNWQASAQGQIKGRYSPSKDTIKHIKKDLLSLSLEPDKKQASIRCQCGKETLGVGECRRDPTIPGQKSWPLGTGPRDCSQPAAVLPGAHLTDTGTEVHLKSCRECSPGIIYSSQNLGTTHMPSALELWPVTKWSTVWQQEPATTPRIM